MKQVAAIRNALIGAVWVRSADCFLGVAVPASIASVSLRVAMLPSDCSLAQGYFAVTVSSAVTHSSPWQAPVCIQYSCSGCLFSVAFPFDGDREGVAVLLKFTHSCMFVRKNTGEPTRRVPIQYDAELQQPNSL